MVTLRARARRAPAVQRARARHCTTCIEALKPALQNGGQRLQGFSAQVDGMVLVPVQGCPSVT